jgi:hypothetical protein
MTPPAPAHSVGVVPSPNPTQKLLYAEKPYLSDLGRDDGGVYHHFPLFFCGGCITGPPGVPGCASGGSDGSGGGFTKDEV